MIVYARCMTHHLNNQDNKDEENQTLYLSAISRLCYCAVVGMADGGCAGCCWYHTEFSDGDAVLKFVHAQAYFPSGITTWVIG